jgi:ASC-1-like (ASCH) protein
MYQANLQDTWWQAVLNGTKTIEGRPRLGKHALVHPGMNFEFRNNDTGQVVAGVITGVRYYPNFKAMLFSEGLNHVLPGYRSLEAGLDVYYQIPGYIEAEKAGVVAIELNPFGAV